MFRNILCFFILLFSIASYSQNGCANVIWVEDFESYPDLTQQAIKWTTNANNCDDNNDPPGTDYNDNYWGVRTTNGNKEFCCNDIEGLTCCGNNGYNDNIWLSESINISAYLNISISIKARVIGDVEDCANVCSNGGDELNAMYSVDGGAWTSFFVICGAESGFADTSCIDVGNGDSLRIRVVLGNQANNEKYFFDDITVCEEDCNTILPIELYSFEAENIDKRYNLIKWSTQSELNNDYFTIEKSTDGFNWVVISKVQGSGNSNSIKNYDSKDFDYNEAINYYRLTQTDFDGKSETFNIISVDNRHHSEVAKIINLLGQEVDINYKGMKIIIFSDGSKIKSY